MQDFYDVDMPLATYNLHCVAIRQFERACKNLLDLSSMTHLYHYEDEVERLLAIVQDLKDKYFELRKEFSDNDHTS